MKRRLLFLFLLVYLTACTPECPPPSAEDIQTAIAQTEAAAVLPATGTPGSSIPTLTPPETSPPQASITPTFAGPLSGRVSSTFLNLRSGPSTLHTWLGTFPEGTEISATGRISENEWVRVELENAEGDIITGWMAVAYLELDDDIEKLPIIYFPDSQRIQGRVETTAGELVNGVRISVIYRSAVEDLFHESISSTSGEFYTYLPEDMFGTLDIQITSIDCASIVMGADCELEGYIQVEWITQVVIPHTSRIVFLFEATSLTLQGTVKSGGRPVAGISVKAERDDGAVSYGKTNTSGNFNIPIADGIWQVYTISADTGAAGTPVTVAVTGESPEPISLNAP